MRGLGRSGDPTEVDERGPPHDRTHRGCLPKRSKSSGLLRITFPFDASLYASIFSGAFLVRAQHARTYRQELETMCFAAVCLSTLADDMLRLLEIRITAIWTWGYKVVENSAHYIRLYYISD